MTIRLVLSENYLYSFKERTIMVFY